MKKIVMAICFVALVMSSSAAFALDHHEEPSDIGVLADVVVLRPFGAAALVAGMGIFIVALPFSLITNSVDGTAKALIKKPFHYVFVRDVGDI